MVVAFGERLSKDYGDRLDARGAEYLSLATAAAARMTRLLDDLVDFGRLGLAAARGSRFDAGVILDQTIENFDEPIRESGAAITRGALPRIYGNPIRFQRLMQNLIGNALKYVAEGVGPRIHVSATREGDFWLFAVADNGIGIEPRYYNRVFEPFKRLHSKSRYDGSGLGLAISRKIVEGFGGVISVHSTESEGSIFTFTIRIVREENDHAAVDALAS
jgi:light-regulated signal transduction histidine kinase (bacteriophytochrome)